jgi:type VI secretion system protein ImpK
VADSTPVRVATHGGLAEMSAGIIKQLADLTPESDGQGLRPRFEDLFRDFETRALRSGCVEADVKLAKYALAALIDETILLSDLPIKDEWLVRPLQMQYFDDFSAGEEFYNKLDVIRLGKTSAAADVMEVYHLCLAFGFKGKHGDARGEERRRVLMEGLANDIGALRSVKPDGRLSPQTGAADALPIPSKALSFLGRGPVWAVPLIVLAVLLVVYVTLGLIDDHSLQRIPLPSQPGAAP